MERRGGFGGFREREGRGRARRLREALDLASFRAGEPTIAGRDAGREPSRMGVHAQPEDENVTSELEATRRSHGGRRRAGRCMVRLSVIKKLVIGFLFN